MRCATEYAKCYDKLWRISIEADPEEVIATLQEVRKHSPRGRFIAFTLYDAVSKKDITQRMQVIEEVCDRLIAEHQAGRFGRQLTIGDILGLAS